MPTAHQALFIENEMFVAKLSSFNNPHPMQEETEDKKCLVQDHEGT